MMVDKLKTLPPIASCHFPAPKKKAQNVANKKKSRNLIKIEQKSNPEYGQNINPISRLIQIQQAKKEKEPVYTLIAERGMPRRREFVMQVGSSDIVYIFHRCCPNSDSREISIRFKYLNIDILDILHKISIVYVCHCINYASNPTFSNSTLLVSLILKHMF